MERATVVDSLSHISATELGRTPGQLVSRVSEGGERLVITNQNLPAAAMVPIADLRRLMHLDDADGRTLPPPGGVTPLSSLTAPVGHAAIGKTDDGQTVVVKLAEHTLLAGSAGCGKSTTLSAMIAGARCGAIGPSLIVAGKGNWAPRLAHRPVHQVPAAEVFLAAERDPSALIRHVTAHLDSREALLGGSGADSASRWNSTLNLVDEPLNDIIVILDDVNLWSHPDFSAPRLVERVLDRGSRLGVFLWAATTAIPRPALVGRFTQIIAQRCSVATNSWALLGDESAQRLQVGQAVLLDSHTPDQRRLFRVSPPD